jgi:GLPGLI family protein
MNKLLFLLIHLAIAKHSFCQFTTAKNLLFYERQFNYGWNAGATNVISSTCYLFYNDTSAYYIQIPDKNRKTSFDNGGQINTVLLADTLNRLYINLTKSISYSVNNNKLHKGIYGDSIYNMTWTLTNETKIIDSIICEKATGYFRGRKYIAWYASKIAIPFGPYKFGGLPGLIVELYDEDKIDHYILRKAEYSSMQYLCFNNKPYISRKIWIQEELAMRKKLIEASQATNNEGNCLNCRGTSEITFTDWEKLEE